MMAQPAAVSPIIKTPAPSAYDAVVYTGYPFQQAHPDRLAALAILRGCSLRRSRPGRTALPGITHRVHLTEQPKLDD